MTSIVEKQATYCGCTKCSNFFHEEMVAARDHYSIQGTTQQEVLKFVIVSDGSLRDKVVQWCTDTIFGCCSCKVF